MATPDRAPTVLAATRIEARAVRRALPGARVVRVGVALSRPATDALDGPIVTCGLAGSLRSDVPTGTVLIPSVVLRPGGGTLVCDSALVAALTAGARRLGLTPDCRPLVTSRTLVVGRERQAWAERGCAAADMETGLLHAARLATVRVALDTPERELSGAWQRPATALWRPRAWTELAWLAREGPRCARLAAEVLAAALSGA
jgi:4-hydroxy-3-methylbut-2-enyl diphosphate reductase